MAVLITVSRNFTLLLLAYWTYQCISSSFQESRRHELNQIFRTLTTFLYTDGKEPVARLSTARRKRINDTQKGRGLIKVDPAAPISSSAKSIVQDTKVLSKYFNKWQNLFVD